MFKNKEKVFIKLLLFYYLFNSIYSGSAIRTEGVNEICLEINGTDLFDLTQLGKEQNSIPSFDDGIIMYRLCKNVEGYDGTVIYKKDDETLILAGDINGGKNNNNKVVLGKKNEGQTEVTEVKLVLAQGEKCSSDKNKNYSCEVEILCDENIIYEYQQINSNNPYTTCDFLIKAKSKYACGEKNKYSSSFLAYNIIVGIVGLIGGGLLAIFGYKFVRISIFLVCMCGSGVLAYFLFMPIFSPIVLYVLMGLFIIVGGVIAFLLTRKFSTLSIYMSIIGGVCGAIVGLIIYLAFLSLIDTSYQQILFYASIIIFCGAGIALGIFFVRHICVLGTSAIGSYLMMRGISFFFYEKNKYIDETQIFDCAKTGNYAKIGELIHPEFYIYPAIFIIFTIICSIIQYKINPRSNEVDDYKDLEEKFEKINNISYDNNFIDSKSQESESEGLTPTEVN